MLKVHVILGSVREGRFGEKPAEWIMSKLEQLDEVEAELIDLKEYPLPFFDEPKSPNASGGVYINKEGQSWAEKVGEADAYIMITPEYNHSFSAVLKNALDWVYKQWNKKPVGFISYGSVHGARAVEQLRLVVNELQMVPLSTAIHIPGDVYLKAKEEGVSAFEPLNERATYFLNQLLWWGKILQEARSKSP